MRTYIDGRETWVEQHRDSTVVSWPGGHKRLPRDPSVEEMMHVISFLIADIRAERQSAHKKVAERRYTDGYNDGYNDARRGRVKSA